MSNLCLIFVILDYIHWYKFLILYFSIQLNWSFQILDDIEGEL